MTPPTAAGTLLRSAGSLSSSWFGSVSPSLVLPHSDSPRTVCYCSTWYCSGTAWFCRWGPTLPLQLHFLFLRVRRFMAGTLRCCAVLKVPAGMHSVLRWFCLLLSEIRARPTHRPSCSLALLPLRRFLPSSKLSADCAGSICVEEGGRWAGRVALCSGCRSIA